MARVKLTIFIALLISVVYLALLFCPQYINADPPHPKKHYKWEALPTGEVVLYYLVDGHYSRYVYRMKHEVEPAVDCTHQFKPQVFKLITFSTTMPYWYTMLYEPIRKWNPLTKKYILLEK